MGETPAHLLGDPYPEILHVLSTADDVHQLVILVHPHPRHHRIPGLAVLLHHHEQPPCSTQGESSADWWTRWSRLATWTVAVRSAKADHGYLQSARICGVHALAVHAAKVTQ